MHLSHLLKLIFYLRVNAGLRIRVMLPFWIALVFGRLLFSLHRPHQSDRLLLSIPGHEKSEHRNYEIYSASPGDNKKVFGAIHKDNEENHTLIVGANKTSVTGLLTPL